MHCALRFALCTVHVARCAFVVLCVFVHCALCFAHCALRFALCALRVARCALCFIVHCALCFVHCALNFVLCALCFMLYARFGFQHKLADGSASNLHMGSSRRGWGSVVVLLPFRPKPSGGLTCSIRPKQREGCHRRRQRTSRTTLVKADKQMLCFLTVTAVHHMAEVAH
jgi:hypothetical protein